MLPPIKINLSGVIDEFSLSEEDASSMINATLRHLALRFAELWDIQASVLKTARKEYKNSITITEDNPYKVKVQLVGWLANSIESGQEPFDMKIGFLNSKKRKYTKDGNPYLIIPRRFGIPTTLGEGTIFGGTLPDELYEILRPKNNPESGQTTLGSSVKTGKPLELPDIPKQFQIIDKRPKIITKNQVWDEYVNKATRYEGIQRMGKEYEKTNQGQYVSFRTVSLKTNKNAWIHKGIQARNFAEKALGELNIEHEVDIIIDEILSKI